MFYSIIPRIVSESDSALFLSSHFLSLHFGWKRVEYCFESAVSEANSVSSAKSSVSSLWHTNNGLRGTH